MTATPTMAEVDELLEDVQAKRDLFTSVLAAVDADETIEVDDQAVEICRRLAIPVLPPQVHDDEMGTEWCDVCGTAVVSKEKHGRWHLRIQAATKLSYWVADLSFKHTALLGMTLALTLDILRDNLADAEEEWTPSRHGWIYPQGDPPGSLRARCGGPVMCAKCRADEQHSIAAGDGAAQAYYVRKQEEKDRP